MNPANPISPISPFNPASPLYQSTVSDSSATPSCTTQECSDTAAAVLGGTAIAFFVFVIAMLVVMR